MEEEDRQLLDAFVERVRIVPVIEAIVLYGSMARGDYDTRSDIDLMIVIKCENPLDYLSEVSAIITDLSPHREISPVLTNLYDYDAEFYKNVFRDGVVLYGKLVLTEDQLALQPHYLISYDLSGLSSSNRSRISQQVYGYTSKKRVGDKTYEYRYPGVLDTFDAIAVSRATVILNSTDGIAFTQKLDRMGVSYRSWQVWL